MSKSITFSHRAALGLFTLASGMAMAADQGSGGIEEIVVTAQKRSERLHDVPIAVTAFTQDRMDMMGLQNINGLQEATPNMNFAVQTGDQYSAKVTLRGVGTETTEGGGDPGVALHIDNVYVGRNSAAAIDIYDVERVEVLRGPQGTLYGRNANGGSVNIVTRRPQEEQELSGDVTYGKYDWVRVRGVLNQPLSDNLAARLAIYSDTRDGYMNNLYDGGKDAGDKDSQGGRLQLLWRDVLGGEVLLRAYTAKNGGVGPANRLLGADIPTADHFPDAFLIGIGAGGFPPVSADVFHNFNGNVNTPTLKPLPKDLWDVRKDANESMNQRMSGVDLQGDWELSSGIRLRSISSYQKMKSDILIDSDSSELPIETRGRDNHADQFSQEFNLLSADTGPLTWILGAFYYTESLSETLKGITLPGTVPVSLPLPPFAVPGGGGAQLWAEQDYDNDSYAVFGQATYDITEQLSLTLGARQTWDKKSQDRSRSGIVDLTTNDRFTGFGAKGYAPPDSSSDDWSKATWKAVVDYKFSDDHMVYVSYSTGFKAGGFDLNSPTVAGELSSYQPETVDAWEIGTKNLFLDGRMTLDIAAFEYDYQDLQTFRLTAFGPRTDNAASSTIKGVEAELSLQPTDELHIDASVGYLDATYDEFVLTIPPPGVDLSGNTLNNAPDWTGHVGVEYVIPMGGHHLIPRIDWSYKGDTYYDRGNSPFDMQEAYSLWNARVRYDAENWYVDLFGSNLGNEQFVTAQLINPPFSCGCRSVNVGAPRMYGITVGFRN